MNIRGDNKEPEELFLAYRRGHRDARHAAAEIAAEGDALVEELAKALGAMLTHMGMDEDEWNKVTFNQARAALAKVRG